MNEEKIDKLVHDGNSCLNSVVMNAELVKALVTRQHDPDKIRQLMDVIITQCQKCSDVLENYRQGSEE